MYSYGSSARVGIGKSGHGGRNYRPPKPRRDPNATPPPLKQCNCLCQLDLPEYRVASPRSHTAFGGRNNLSKMEQQLRSLFYVHLVVPGRKQAGPVAIVGASYRQVVPAALYFLGRLHLPATSSSQSTENAVHRLSGRIQRNFQDRNDRALEGFWVVPTRGQNDADQGESPRPAPLWIFESPQWSAMGCVLPELDETEDNGTGEANELHRSESNSTNMEDILLASVDNIKFRCGTLDGLDIFLHDSPPGAFGAGKCSLATILFEEVQKAVEQKE